VSSISEVTSLLPDTPEEMLKRIFAVAELLAKAKTEPGKTDQYEPNTREKTQKDNFGVS
jgi:hypothetical protein